MWQADTEWFRSDSFTVWNDSYSLNREVGDVFLAVRGRLPEGVTERLEEFLVTFCPRLLGDGDLAPPQDPDVCPDWFYAAASPAEVRRRLALLDGVDLPSFFALYYDQFLAGQPDRREFALAREREVVEYFFMWSAAMGQAAAKGWGLVVGIG